MSHKHRANRYFSGKILVEQLIKRSGHRLSYFRLEDGSEWIYKQLARENWLGTIHHSQVCRNELLGFEINSWLAHHFPDYQGGVKSQIVVEQDKIHLLRPYFKGAPVRLPSPEQAFFLGQVLARMHAMAKPEENFEYWPAITWPPDFEPAPWMKEVNTLIDQHSYYQKEYWVASHRDLHMGNLLWSEDKLAAIIDWESAGLTHPFVDLIGLAVNCAGVADAVFRPQHFSMTLQGYQSVAPLPAEDELLWFLCFHSWLLWLIYIWKSKSHDLLKPSLDAMDTFRAHLALMKKIYWEKA
ncbi:putative aminoglycoside phosphotransferase [Legionella birminghamensis]|uniref:Aminoglycoside phosphotransferase n=1 Tax=Legionella birminghamensis TaxID=28083 RepID=A0A378I710_9GAMM|nr:phosphotransferase [Legionella birminghamensis]KTC72500.1 putative aminoglycoside phosphotransferase [Legionella birminghamensis]STX30632.1 putative aminoglycoside phosphotransferase [Legionella birminghamensis]